MTRNDNNSKLKLTGYLATELFARLEGGVDKDLDLINELLIAMLEEDEPRALEVIRQLKTDNRLLRDVLRALKDKQPREAFKLMKVE